MPDASPACPHRSGYVVLCGRPNSGKSTLLNQLLGQKLSIVTDKPQTTRRRVLGIKTLPGAQLLFVDTPGIHAARDLLNRRMVQVARHAMDEADVLVWVIDSVRPGRVDRDVAEGLLQRQPEKVCVALNKVDLADKGRLVAQAAALADLLPNCDVIPVSALTGENVDRLLSLIAAKLPEGPSYYPEDMVTDQTERALVEEIVREKVLLETHDEVPYAAAVTVDTFEERPERNLVVIKATIHVNRASQKPIVIGQRGARIKRIGQLARQDLETQLGHRVYLELFVRVQEGWTADTRRMKEFGL